jgi:hypothetical protein
VDAVVVLKGSGAQKPWGTMIHYFDFDNDITGIQLKGTKRYDFFFFFFFWFFETGFLCIALAVLELTL